MAFLAVLSAFLFFQAVSGCGVSVDLLRNTWGLIDGGEIEPYSHVLRDSILENAATNAQGKLFALGATFTGVSELSWVRPASSCAYANLINANLGNGCLSKAIDGYAVVLAQAVENIRILGQCCVLPSPWPTLDNSCGDYGRIYNFEASWDKVKGFPTKEARCAARDLYTSFTARPNNVGAAATSAATSPALSIIGKIQNELINFLETATSTGGCCNAKSKKLRSQAGALKAAIFKAAACVKG